MFLFLCAEKDNLRSLHQIIVNVADIEDLTANVADIEDLTAKPE